MLEDQLVEITEQPSVNIYELKNALSALLQLGKGPLSQQLLLKAYGSRLLKKIDGFLPSCSIYEETYPVTLSKLNARIFNNFTDDKRIWLDIW
ncbi:hypothetical protein GIB67_004746 [Kingdonia uniflora]|uniref:Uncharacterized protein n=1 Tax=Kingdonia uniflora TaxID=39325 RepID=A0A7J7NQJ6_9MAGN|nr:hypothetical protein GIB67_004746 [Kingdonia uniflora]